MKFNKKKIEEMISQLDDIRNKGKLLEKKYDLQLNTVNIGYKKSAVNLLHYLALRHEDIHQLQTQLGLLGVSRLGKAESHVFASILAVKNILRHFLKAKKYDPMKTAISLKQGKKIINTNTNALLGKKLKGSKVRIMVTLPTEAAYDKKFVRDLVSSGMNCARINCAHDDEEIWMKMIENIKKARRKTGRNCKICMDLGGPKLRTGTMLPGPSVIHLHPQRDSYGQVISPEHLFLIPEGSIPPSEDDQFLPIAASWLKNIRSGDEIRFKDTRGKRRKLAIEDKTANGFVAKCCDSAYLKTGTELILSNDRKSNGAKIEIGNLAAKEQHILLNIGDTLVLHKDPTPGEPSQFDVDINVTKPAHIACTLPQVFEDVRAGEPIILDDGKIEGVIRSVSEEEIIIEITYAKEGGAKLRADKGINLPESNLRLIGLTDKDKQDLKFITKHADVVNFSFVNKTQDVIDLLSELQTLHASDLGIILKIETRHGFKNLPGILLCAMRNYPIGVMIARGDLAIEGGWKQLAQLQQEIMLLCESAHVPVVWATQVLETLAKKGRPSRAEITDAAMAQRAECVMLNKGPHIIETIQLLDEIMKSMEEYHQKQAPMLPRVATADYLNFR
jgi:pyruvate kinase